MVKFFYIFAVYRILIHAHHIRELLVKKAIIRPGNITQYLSKRIFFTVAQLGNVLLMALAYNICAVRVLVKKGQVYYKMLILSYNSFFSAVSSFVKSQIRHFPVFL